MKTANSEKTSIYGDLEHSREYVDKSINGDDKGNFKFKNGQRSVFDTLIETHRGHR
jgi:hypothetical protein